MIKDFEKFEQPILNEIAGHFPELSAILLAQMQNLQSCHREINGGGLFSHFIPPKNTPLFPESAKLEPISLFLEDLEPLNQGASITLFFHDSKIDMLDAAPCDETWPEDWVPASFKMTWFD